MIAALGSDFLLVSVFRLGGRMILEKEKMMMLEAGRGHGEVMDNQADWRTKGEAY